MHEKRRSWLNAVKYCMVSGCVESIPEVKNGSKRKIAGLAAGLLQKSVMGSLGPHNSVPAIALA
jgi:hypothetical protein